MFHIRLILWLPWSGKKFSLRAAQYILPWKIVRGMWCYMKVTHSYWCAFQFSSPVVFIMNRHCKEKLYFSHLWKSEVCFSSSVLFLKYKDCRKISVRHIIFQFSILFRFLYYEQMSKFSLVGSSSMVRHTTISWSET